MIVSLSDNFRRLAAKVYTFGFLFLSVKFLSVETVTLTGVKVSLLDSGVIAGALSLATLAITLAAIPCLLRDYFVTASADQASGHALPRLDHDTFMTRVEQETTFLERNFSTIQALSWITFVIEAVFPIVLGLVVAFLGRQDMLHFVKTTTI